MIARVARTLRGAGIAGGKCSKIRAIPPTKSKRDLRTIRRSQTRQLVPKAPSVCVIALSQRTKFGQVSRPERTALSIQGPGQPTQEDFLWGIAGCRGRMARHPRRRTVDTDTLRERISDWAYQAGSCHSEEKKREKGHSELPQSVPF